MDNIEEILRALGEQRSRGSGGRGPRDNTKYYKTLGIEKNATQEEINKAYIELSKKVKGNKDKVRELEEAFDVLSDPDKRKEYDNGPEEEKDGGDDMQNIFDLLQKQNRKKEKPRRPKMKPMQFALEASLDDIYKGEVVKMRVTRMRLCSGCKGKGCKPGAKASVCETCDGHKVVMKAVQIRPGMYAQTRAPCDDCKGTGMNMDEGDRCTVCKGEKIMEDKKEIDVKLNPGVPENHVYTFAGEGHEVPDADAGDVMFVVRQKPHPRFKRRKQDLILEQEISLEDALCGGKFSIEHLCGKKTTIILEKGKIVKPNDILMIDNLGMPEYPSTTAHGKLYLIMSVKSPTTMEEDKRTAMLKAIEAMNPKRTIPEDIKEKVVMKDFHPNQKNAREDGDIGSAEEHHEEHEHEHHQGGGIPCQAQ